MSSYEKYYADQNGGTLPVYGGVAYQRGHGLGNTLNTMRIIGGLLPHVIPFAKEVFRDGILKAGMKRIFTMKASRPTSRPRKVRKLSRRTRRTVSTKGRGPRGTANRDIFG